MTKLTEYDSIWDALEDDPIKAENMKIRSDLLITVNQKINSEGFTQTQAARILGVTQPRISALSQGKIEQFRLDTLVNFALKLGLHVDLHVAA